MTMKKINFLFTLLIAFLSFGCTRNLVDKGLSPLTTQPTATKLTPLANTGTGGVGDANIKYFGRWDTSSTTQYVSDWGGAYIRVNFSGTAGSRHPHPERGAGERL
jgi:hypothetical protein